MENQLKPVTIRIEELRKNLQTDMFNSQLPPFLLEMVLGELLTGISSVARKEYMDDLTKWESEQKDGEANGKQN